MKIINLLMWVGQFGFSVIFPTVLFLVIGVWLQNKFGFGLWILVVCGILGILTSIQTARSCYASMDKAARELSGDKEPPVSFNDHT